LLNGYWWYCYWTVLLLLVGLVLLLSIGLVLVVLLQGQEKEIQDRGRLALRAKT
jgi:hypothetical protein